MCWQITLPLMGNEMEVEPRATHSEADLADDLTGF